MTGLLTRNTVRTLSAAFIAVATSLLLPLLFHLLPAGDGVPLGARLLPIFYAPFLAAIFFSPAVSLIAALAAPALNHLLTGRPAAEMLPMLTLELLLFVGIVLLAKRRWPVLPILAPVAYILAHFAAALILGVPHQVAMVSLQTALPGVGILLAISLVVALSQRQNRSSP